MFPHSGYFLVLYISKLPKSEIQTSNIGFKNKNSKVDGKSYQVLDFEMNSEFEGYFFVDSMYWLYLKVDVYTFLYYIEFE